MPEAKERSGIFSLLSGIPQDPGPLPRKKPQKKEELDEVLATGLRSASFQSPLRAPGRSPVATKEQTLVPLLERSLGGPQRPQEGTRA